MKKSGENAALFIIDVFLKGCCRVKISIFACIVMILDLNQQKKNSVSDFNKSKKIGRQMRAKPYLTSDIV